jgi:hypothetical protein
MALLVVIAIALAFVAGVAEANRVLKALHIAEGAIHLTITNAETAIHERIAELEKALKEKL